ncbi:SMC-Scp complex subunit ScpB [Labrenzia aggregata]|uniref:SMC-Scp complex subunit ScpB n=2 Tax=Roseibium aggregatum TaxID=187304 RepID=A0A939EBV1_9HYPH|nr:SMC-Scp complex subunit ScpB [Roseibium aggregatum]
MAPEDGHGVASERGDDRESIGRDDLSVLRMVEALLFASSDPLSLEELTLRLPDGTDVLKLLETLEKNYAPRGINLVKVAGKWCFRTADDLAFLMHKNVEEQRKLSRAALETLAIIAYHQPVTRAEIEEIRGVSTSKGTLDVLLETTWIRMRGRRRTPGRPVTYGTTEQFLIHFGLESVKDLPGLEELKGAGLLDSAVPASFLVPTPNDDAALNEEEDALEDGFLFGEDTEETAGA